MARKASKSAESNPAPKKTKIVTSPAPDTVVRAVTFTVDHVLDEQGERVPWGDFQAELNRCMRAAACLSNWLMTELWTRDAQRDPSEDAPKMPKGELLTYKHVASKYPFWRHWDGMKGSASSVMRSVKRKYMQTRFATRWTFQEQLPGFGRETPFPIRYEDARVLWIENAGIDGHVSRRPAVSMRLGTTRFTVVLSGGQEFRRQLATFRKIESGEFNGGEVAIYRRRKFQGSKSHSKVFVKLVATMPVHRQRSGRTIFLHTDPAAFWVAEINERQPWIVNADHIQRWKMRHAVYLQRISEDTKFEKRWPAKMRRKINASRNRRCDKMNARFDTWSHEVSKMFVRFAERQGVDLVTYDDTIKSYLPSFDWFVLKTRLRDKLHQAGIAFVDRGNDGVDAADGDEAGGDSGHSVCRSPQFRAAEGRGAIAAKPAK